jgi:hypothetical protein
VSDRVSAISKSLREVVIAEGLCPPEKIKVLEHGSIDGVAADCAIGSCDDRRPSLGIYVLGPGDIGVRVLR